MVIPWVYSEEQKILIQICLIISIICLTLNLIVYSIIPQLRNVPGKCLMFICVTLIFKLLAYIVSFHIEVDPNNKICFSVAVIRFYGMLAAVFWTNVMSYDIYKTFQSLNGSQRENLILLKYSAYAYLGPIVIVCPAVYLEFTDEINMFRPMFGYLFCGFSQWSSIIVFVVIPVFLLLSVNLIFFVLTILKIRLTTSQTELVNDLSFRVRLSWYLKLSLVFGVFSLICFAGVIIRSVSLINYIFMLILSLQGEFH